MKRNPTLAMLAQDVEDVLRQLEEVKLVQLQGKPYAQYNIKVRMQYGTLEDKVNGEDWANDELRLGQGPCL